jgi:hypothetical protein
MAVLAEVKVVIASKEARIMLIRGDQVVEDEVWSFRPAIDKASATELARVMFDDMYDFVNLAANGAE